VERQLSQAREKYQLVELKTRYSRRTLILADATIDSLRAHLNRQHLERQFAAENWNDTGLVFTNTVGKPLDHRHVQRQFKALSQAAGLPVIRFHDLRHTAASIMLNRGVQVILVSRILGHSKPSITMDMYGHLLPGGQNEVAAMMNDVITSMEVSLPETSQTGPNWPQTDPGQQPTEKEPPITG
jgi:integrase